MIPDQLTRVIRKIDRELTERKKKLLDDSLSKIFSLLQSASFYILAGCLIGLWVMAK
jgi:hypothetical protein